MHRLASNDLLISIPPFQAYADDVARVGGHAPLSADDDAWLVLAQTLARAAALSVDMRGEVLSSGGAALLAGPHDAAGAALIALGRALAGGHAVAITETASEAAARIQDAVASQERNGAFRLAFGTLASARLALTPFAEARALGLLLAHQGRAARQLGAMEAARQLYRSAAIAGRRAGAADVMARAMMGLGALANMRGNYPEARASYRRALGYARRASAKDCERAAHHGLLNVATVAGDFDAALAHGWNAFAGTPDTDHDARAEMLVNLAEIARKADQHRAALGACLTAVELTTNPRLCLPALGVAAMSAATLRESVLLVQLIERAERIIAVSSNPYENAFTLLELADASATAGLERSAALARRAAEIAEACSFYEIAMRAERLLHAPAGDTASRQRSQPPHLHLVTSVEDRRWSPQARRAIRSLETLVPGRARVAG